MFSLSANPEYALYLLIWLGLWSLGGIWIVRRVFQLEAGEEVILGILTGLIIETILANFIGRVLPMTLAFWLCAVLVFAAGLLLNLKIGWKNLLKIKIRPVQMAVFLLLFGVSFLISRGFAIYDDFANIPTVSMIAAGNIPPIYSLAPTVTYAYHYFVMLFTAQVIRISGLYVWTAFDLARALVYALTITAAGLWGYRMTRSKVAGALTGLVTALGSGTRWLLLLIPPGILARLSAHITLIGSGANTAPTLAKALMNNWAIEGGGPRHFSFAFGNGLIGNGAMSMFASNSTINTALIFLLLMTFNRWRSKWALVVTVFLIGATGLMSETFLVLMTAAWGLLAVLTAIRQRSLSFPPEFKSWLLAAALGTAFALLQGGALTDTIASKINVLFTGAESTSYQTLGFVLAWPAGDHLLPTGRAVPVQPLAAAHCPDGDRSGHPHPAPAGDLGLEGLARRALVRSRPGAVRRYLPGHALRQLHRLNRRAQHHPPVHLCRPVDALLRSISMELGTRAQRRRETGRRDGGRAAPGQRAGLFDHRVLRHPAAGP